MPTVRDVEHLVSRLSTAEQIQLVRRLEAHTWGQRLDALVSRIRQRAPRLSQREILRVCRDVRRARAERARRA